MVSLTEIENNIPFKQEEIDKPVKYMTLADAERTRPMHFDYKRGMLERFQSGIISGIEAIKDIPQQIEIFGNEVSYTLSGFGGDKEEINRKKSNLDTAIRNLEEVQKERDRYSSRAEQESLAYGVGAGVPSYAIALAGGYVGGSVAAVLGATEKGITAAATATGLASMAPQQFGSEVQQKLPRTEEGEIDYQKITPEWAMKAEGGAVVATVVNLVLEKKLGLGEQIKVWRMPIKFGKSTTTNIARGLAKGGVTAVSEGITEGLQDLASYGVSLIDGTATISELPEQLQQSLKSAIIGGILGGTVGTSVAIHEGYNFRKQMRDMIAPVVQDVKKAEQIADAIYNSANDTMTNVISKELELDSQLKARRGNVYNSMLKAVSKAIDKSGGYTGLTEEQKAQHATEVANMFADQALVEANKRGVLIEDVVNAKDIVYQDGEIRLAPKGKSGKELKQSVDLFKINDEVTGIYGDEFYKKMTLYSGDEQLGYIEYSVVDDEPYIQMIQVPENQRRKGYATELVKRLQREYPNKEINFGMMTREGSKLYKSLPKRIEVNTEYDVMKKKLQDSNKKLKKYEKILDQVTGEETGKEQERIIKAADGWQEEHSKNQEYRDWLENNKRETVFIDTGDLFQENAQLDAENPAYEGETININGVDKTVYNSDGERIAQSEAALRNFYNWFGDSKVVDEQGRPLVVYHGTSDKFDVFLKEKRGELTGAKSAKEGFWFTDGKYTAESYAKYSAENSGIKKLEKQQRIAENQGNWDEYDRLTEEIEKLALDGTEKEPIVMPVYLKAENVNTFDAKNQTFMNIQDKINSLLEKSDNKDGLIIYNLKDAVENIDKEAATHIMVREPNQIKSTSNRGTYSESENIYYQEGNDRDLVVTHATTLDKLEEALDLGAMPMPSLSVTKADLAADTNFGEIIFVGGKDIVNPEDKRNKTFSADIYSTRKVKPEYEITKDGVDYIQRQTGNISEKGEYYWVANISSDLERGSDYHLREIYLASKGKISNLDTGTYSIVNSMTEKEKSDFSEWKRKFINDYTNKKIFEGFTPSGKRRYTQYNLDNILRIMKSKNIQGSEGDLNAHALRGIWAKEFKTIDEIRKAKGKLVDESTYKKMDNIIWKETTKLSDLLVSEEKAQELERSYISPDDYMIEEVLVAIKPNSNIGNLLKKADLRFDAKAVEAVKKYIDKVNSLPVKYFESKPQRAVNFSEFVGVILPLDSAYDTVAKRLEEYGLDVIRAENYKEAIEAFEDTFFQGNRIKRGSFNEKSKVIKLFKDANTSTLPHELAHYWLDNMYSYVRSGAASVDYLNQFKAVKDFLGIRDNQEFLTRKQQEKFASGYEKYIHRGIIPNSIMGNVYDGYERWLRDVYDSIEDIKAQGKLPFKLTPEIIKFFDSMLTGGLSEVASQNIADTARLEEMKEADDAVVKESKQAIEAKPIRPTSELLPVKSEGEERKSRLYERMKDLGDAEDSLGYNEVTIEEQREKAQKLWQNNPEQAQSILNDVNFSNDILRNAVYTEQQRLALENGDSDTFLESLRKQSAEATRIGQELSALRGVFDDITMPSYWIRQAENEAHKQLAKKMTSYLDRLAGKTSLESLTKQLDDDINSLTKEMLVSDDKVKTLSEGIKELKEKYKGLDQKDVELYQEEFTNEEEARKYVEKKAKEAIGLYLTDEQANNIIQMASNLDKMSGKFDKFGVPSEKFFAEKAKLEKAVNEHTPTSQVKVLISTIGRANMLTAPATSVLNVVSNLENYAIQKMLRYINNNVTNHTNDNIVDSDLAEEYRKKLWSTFWNTGYDASTMRSLTDTKLYKGESVTHSEGDGAIREIGRFAEKYVFSRLISSPDIYFKSMRGFTDYIGNEATDIAYKEGLTGEKAKKRANDLFLDATRIEPQTEEGKLIRQKAQTEAAVITYQQDTELSKNLLKLRDLINKGTGDIGIGDILSPFVKTPANILSMGYDATVGAFGHPKNLIQALNDLRSGNLQSDALQTAIRQTTNQVLAGVLISVILSTLIDDDDYIPDYSQLSQRERNAVREAGGTFGSVKIGNTYISTDFFGPLEMPLVAWLNARRAKGLTEKASAFGGAVIREFLDAPVIRDTISSSKSLENIGSGHLELEEALYNYLGDTISSRLTPNLLNVLAKISDDYERKAGKSITDKLMARIPVLREQLPTQVSMATGKPIETQSAWLQILFGARAKEERNSVLAKEFMRLSKTGNGASISDPTKYGDLRTLPDDMKPKVLQDFSAMYSKEANRIIKLASYKKASDDDKKNMLDKARRKVTKEIKQKYKKYLKKKKQ